jgi:hypothetical protein
MCSTAAQAHFAAVRAFACERTEMLVSLLYHINYGSQPFYACLRFVLEAVAPDPLRFFARTSFDSFLRVLRRVKIGQENRRLLPHAIPRDRMGRFFCGGLFARLVDAAMAPPNDPAAPLLAAFMIEHVTAANVKSVVAAL